MHESERLETPKQLAARVVRFDIKLCQPPL
jgi:hypothetical protein